MMKTTALLVLITLSGVVSQGHAGDVSCREVAKYALIYRDIISKNYGSHFGYLTKSAMVYTGVDISSDDEIMKITCTIMETGSIRNASRVLQRMFMVTGEQKLELGLLGLKNNLKSDIKWTKNCQDKNKGVLTLKEQLGLPEFPVALDESEIEHVLDSVTNSSLELLFRRFHSYFYDPVYYSVLDKAALINALKEADSVTEFVKLANRHANGDYYYTYDEYQEDAIHYELEYFMERLDSAAKNYDECKTTLNEARTFLSVLKESGILDITRGGSELYTCDFISDLVLEALDYAVELFGREVQRVVSRDLSLSLRIDDECAVKKLVCSIASSKSQKELEQFIPAELRPADFSAMYPQIGITLLTGLSHAQSEVENGMSYMRVFRMLDQLGYPDFPLAVTHAQAKQLAAYLAAFSRHTEVDVDELAQAIIDAESLNDLYEKTDVWVVTVIDDVMGVLGGKLDLLPKLASVGLQLFMTVDELGLLMLPDV